MSNSNSRNYYYSHKQEISEKRADGYSKEKRAKYNKAYREAHKEEILKQLKRKKHLIKVIDSAINGETIDMTHEEFKEFLRRIINEEESDVIRDIRKKRN